MISLILAREHIFGGNNHACLLINPSNLFLTEKKAPKKKSGKKRKRTSTNEPGEKGDEPAKQKKSSKPKKTKSSDGEKTEESEEENAYDTLSSLSPDSSDDEAEVWSQNNETRFLYRIFPERSYCCNFTATDRGSGPIRKLAKPEKTCWME